MAKGTAGTIIGTGVFVVTSICGVCMTAYSVATAYLMGAEAQSHVTQTTTADPMTLLRESVESLKVRMGLSNENDHSPIDIDDANVTVTDATE